MKKVECWDNTIELVKEQLASGIEKIEGYKENTEDIWFHCKNGAIVHMYHDQNCCESVWLYSSDGLSNNFDVFTGCDWCVVDEITDHENLAGVDNRYDESYTWTFYNFKTNKGYDTMRWYGTSNGCYSESVDFEVYLP